MKDRREQLEKLLEADPDDAFVTYALAMEHLKHGEPERAIPWLDRTLEIDPATHYAYFQKAKAYQALGRMDDALAAADAGVNSATVAGDAKALGELQELRSALS